MTDDQKPLQDERATVRYYGKFDGDGAPQGFWASDVFPAPEGRKRSLLIPTEAIELTKEQWRELIANQPRARFIKGKVSVLPAPTAPPPPPRSPIDELRDMMADISKRLAALEQKK